MKLYLVRHGEPNSPDVDPDKHLSEKGNRDAKELGRLLKERGVKPQAIFHSGIMRAMETATHIADQLDITDLTQKEMLRPNDSVKKWGDMIESYDHDLMLVGHMPYMSLMIEYLTTGDSTHIFNAPEVVCLERVEKGYWKLLWTLAP